MINIVTANNPLFTTEPDIRYISVEKSIELIESWDMVQFDTETTGRDARLCSIISMQFGNKKGDEQVVVDATTISPLLYKDILETKPLIGQNLKFDVQFLYNYGIVPTKLYDTMIVEQLLHLGYPPGEISYSLQAIAQRRLNIYISKEVRGQIRYKGLDLDVIRYAAGDVKHLGDIYESQMTDCRHKGLVKAAKFECKAIPAIAYMEWCGIHLDEDKWKAKMKKDKENLEKAKIALDNFAINDERFKKYIYINTQGSLFDGFDTTPKCTINWSSPYQVIQVARTLGFNTQVKDKKTGENKDSVIENHLRMQKGINDEFLKLYFDYQEYAKVVSSFGQGHLNAINPKTGRLHTVFRQLSTSSGRLSCGSNQPNTDLAAFKGIPPKNCSYPNLQQLPSDEATRASFTAPEGNLFVSADYSAEESRLGADIYQDEAFLKEFTEGSGDTHNMFAWAVFKEQCKACGCKDATEVKKKAPQWRKKVKAVEFAYMFGAAAPTISKAAECTVEEAQAYIDALDKEFKGMADFARKGSAFVRQNGYIVICPITGHKLFWHDHDKWLERQKSFTREFWEDYRENHKGTGDKVAVMVRQHFQAAGKYDRAARNVVTQGTGAIIMKEAMTMLFNWIVERSLFDKVHICCSVHDELCCDFPQELADFPKILETIMEAAAEKYCKSLPIPAEAEVSSHWVH